jgi:RNA polymerase sporulation-specific sigma factor
MEETDLLKEFQKNPSNTKVLSYLLELYKPIVKSEAKHFFIVGAEYDDLIQEGMIGLFQAINDFNSNLDIPFKSYARICIRRKILNAIASSNTKKNIPLNTYISLSNDNEDEFDKLENSKNTNPENSYIEEENKDILMNNIKNTLSPMENKVLDEILMGYDYMEIASSLNKSPKAIDNAIQRIKNKVKNLTRNSK